MKKIFFVSYGGGHVEALLPVYLKLMSREEYQCSYLALTTAYRKVRDNNLPCIGFKDLVNAENSSSLLKGKSLFERETGNSLISYEESIAYMGLSYCDLVQKYSEQEAKLQYQKYGRQAFYPIYTLKKYLIKEKPDLVIATNSPRAERAAIDAASQLGIPSICLVDLFAFQEISWIGRQGFANKVCVISDYVKKNMITAGRMEEDIIVTGNPAFDEITKYCDAESISTFRRKKNWKEGEQVILWASSIEPEDHPYLDKKGDVLLPVKVEDELCKLVNRYSGLRLVIRPHPNDSRCVVRQPDYVEISSQEENINEILPAVDCVVVMASTVGLQAALISKPLINIKLSVFSKDAPYDEMGLSTGVERLSELNSTVLRLLAEKKESHSLPKVGKATDNIIRVIDDVIACQ